MIFSGCWYDFVNDIGGAPLEAIKHVEKVDLSRAIKIVKENFDMSKYDLSQSGVEYSNFNPQGVEELKPKSREAKIEIDKEKEEHQILKAEQARQIWLQGKPIKNTLGAQYLVNVRKIAPDLLKFMEFRFLPQGAKYTVII